MTTTTAAPETPERTLRFIDYGNWTPGSICMTPSVKLEDGEEIQIGYIVFDTDPRFLNIQYTGYGPGGEQLIRSTNLPEVKREFMNRKDELFEGALVIGEDRRLDPVLPKIVPREPVPSPYMELPQEVSRKTQEKRSRSAKPRSKTKSRSRGR